MIGGRRPLPGRKPADRRVRVERPHSPYFRYAGPGQLVAKRAASGPRTRAGRLIERVKVATIGRALASEEILRFLVLAGAAALSPSIQVAIAIAILLTVVAISYRQVCRAFPNGGG